MTRFSKFSNSSIFLRIEERSDIESADIESIGGGRRAWIEMNVTTKNDDKDEEFRRRPCARESRARRSEKEGEWNEI